MLFFLNSNFLLITFIHNIIVKRNVHTTYLFLPLKITGISLSPFNDQLVIIHLRGGNDFVFAITGPVKDNRAPELVGLLCRQWQLYVLMYIVYTL